MTSLCEARFSSYTSTDQHIMTDQMQKQISESSCLLFNQTLTRFLDWPNNATYPPIVIFQKKNYLLLSSCLSHIESISLTFITTMLMKVISAFCREWKLGNLVVKCISFDPKVCALIPLSHYAKLNKRNKQKNIPAHDCGDEVSFPRKHSHLL